MRGRHMMPFEPPRGDLIPPTVGPYTVSYNGPSSVLHESFNDLEDATRYYATLLKHPDVSMIRLVDYREIVLKVFSDDTPAKPAVTMSDIGM